VQTLALLLIAVPLAAYAGYPLVLLAAARVWGRPVRTGAAGGSVAVVICAHNEGARIGAKLESVLAQTRGSGARVIVADDGSTDDTAEIAARFPEVELHPLPRGGKAAALNRIVPRESDAVLVMTDADPLFDAGTLPALLAPFADRRVGAVAGRVEVLRSPKGSGAKLAGFDALFRRYESAVRQAESDLFGCVSADGGLYAIRASLVPHVPADVTDDFYISTAAVAAGSRIAYADAARVYEHAIASGRKTFRRRIRITVRGLTGLWSRRALMNPARTGWYAPALILHKVARRLAPLVLPPLWLLAGLLAGQGSLPWAIVFAGLTALALVGAVGALAPERLPRVLAPVFGVALHLAGLAWGAVLFVRGVRYAQWTPQKDATS
jgi:cellulose synthase/poly-beta-1,6-N-acetylglucosamine synthase-like glycosyltransferase